MKYVIRSKDTNKFIVLDNNVIDGFNLASYRELIERCSDGTCYSNASLVRGGNLLISNGVNCKIDIGYRAEGYVLCMRSNKLYLIGGLSGREFLGLVGMDGKIQACIYDVYYSRADIMPVRVKEIKDCNVKKGIALGISSITIGGIQFNKRETSV